MGMQGWQRPVVEEVMRLDWRRPNAAGTEEDVWLAAGVDDVGDWWFGALYYSWSRVTGGAPRVAELARWLSEPLQEYTNYAETDFVITDWEPETTPSGEQIEYFAELSRSREVIGGPERLTYAGDQRGVYLGADLVYTPVDRPTVERAAAVLLARAQQSA